MKIRLINGDGQWINVNHIKKMYVSCNKNKSIDPSCFTDSKYYYVEIEDFDGNTYVIKNFLSKEDAHKKLSKLVFSIHSNIDWIGF